MNYSLQIRQYIQSKQGAWAETTIKSESARLYANAEELNKNTQEAHLSLSVKLKPYALKTTMVRLADFKAHTGDYTWKAWIKSNANLYKNTYTRRTEGVITHEEAKRRTALLTHLPTKNILNELLDNGNRASELGTRIGLDCVGKGSKRRKLFGKESISPTQRATLTYREIYTACKAIGTTPHSCRKAFASKLARSGKVTEVDLLKIMGWNSMETAKSYLAPMRDDELTKTLGGIFK